MYFADCYNTKRFNLFAFIALIIFSFLIGVRTNFGNDHQNYMHLYMAQKLDFFEPIYAYLNIFLFSHCIPFQILFTLIAFIEFLFLEKATKLLKVKYFWVILFFFIFRFFAFFVNGLRQAVAISIAMCAVIFYFHKKYIYFILLILLSCGFHKSSVIFLLFCPLTKIIKLSSKKFLDCLFYIPLLFAFVFYDQLWDIILNILQKISFFLPANFQFLIEALSIWKIDIGSGMGVRLQILGYILLLPNLLFFAHKDIKVKYLFLLFYFGVLGKYFSGQNMNLSRLFFGLEYCGIFLFSRIMPNINKNNILVLRNVSFLIGITFYIILFFYDSAKGVNSVGPTPYVWDLDFSFKNYFHEGL